ncbi:hypothetical protein IU449_26915 [Nocardia higoensis]|uniref:Uncharacterized protein n=1 Tax=Nocardia higoensis TaxID=228599 RepID=A0ABS0DI41_9NOCA|nr:hypothetical protein [Nocardia higoensis]MBF6358132.1 hypothetical protein [Nocardia higoensis]
MNSLYCSKCDVYLDDVTEFRCFRCGWKIRDVDNPYEYLDCADAIWEQQ